MVIADTSFLASLYLQQSASPEAGRWMTRNRASVLFTSLLRHELRGAIRQAVFRREIDSAQRYAAFELIEQDLANGILIHAALPWTEMLREADELGAQFVETFGVRSMDLLQIATARVLGATDFLTFDLRQRELAKRAGLQVLP